uniref:XRCC4 coiled-coil domain-containing protein n=1 Tax=Rhodosorus marinus TaxID=101924 RepID=A0A7S0BD90_9RHOD|mmetsp:Transcript_10971/g.15816  ORF Transcript_10971/g.15816 Transcript_10971/m.15816 type:complete len:245 (+) Transcript_10971:87-821(+)
MPESSNEVGNLPSSWFGKVGEDGWILSVSVSGDKSVRIFGVDGSGRSWRFVGSEEDIETRAKVIGGATERLRKVLSKNASGSLRVDEEGEVCLDVPFGNGTVVAARIRLSLGVGFGDQLVSEVNLERSRRVKLEDDLKQLRSKCEKLEKALEACTQAKDELEERMLVRFCEVLNEKKRKIADLQKSSGGTEVKENKRNPKLVDFSANLNSASPHVDDQQTTDEDVAQIEKSTPTLGSVPIEDLL